MVMCLLDARFYAKPLTMCLLVDIPSKTMSYVAVFKPHFSNQGLMQRISDGSKVIQLHIISLRSEFQLQTA